MPLVWVRVKHGRHHHSHVGLELLAQKVYQITKPSCMHLTQMALAIVACSSYMPRRSGCCRLHCLSMSKNCLALPCGQHWTNFIGEFLFYFIEHSLKVPAYQLDLVSEGIVIFVISTTESGVEPRSMTPLWNDLLRHLPPDTFKDLPFSVFGLGDTSYKKFCWAMKKLSRRLQSLRASEFYQHGEGNEQHPLGWVIVTPCCPNAFNWYTFRIDGMLDRDYQG